MFTSFNQAVFYMNEKGITAEFKSRVVGIHYKTIEQNWFNSIEFQIILEKLDYL